ncbi:MAG: hypothetical protein PHQ40_21080 [Anaerolineaceae bacterium]|nr:hypothetical protein [Anaerolineaceae bacterium]
MEDIEKLADLIRRKNAIDHEISRIIARPAQIGHVGEYIASLVFDIQLCESASHRAIDGFFRTGPLSGKSVNVKWYGKQESLLDITPEALPDYYLVMTGPHSVAMTSRGGVRPWTIDHVFLFEAAELLSRVQSRKVKVGVATSIPQTWWLEAEIYPLNNSMVLRLNEQQIRALSLFASS